MRFNVFIDNGVGKLNFLAIDEAILSKLVSAYNDGDESVFFSEKKHLLGDINEIQIFEFDNDDFRDGNDFRNLQIKRNNIKKSLLDIYISKEMLEVYGKKVTDNYIKGEFGYLKKERIRSFQPRLKIPNITSITTKSEKKSNTPLAKFNRKVFIVHGHDGLATE